MNGQVKPQAVEAEESGQPRKWRMVYEEPGKEALPICGVALPEAMAHGVPASEPCKADHPSATAARGCRTALAWQKSLQLHGWRAIQALLECLRAIGVADRELVEALEAKGTWEADLKAEYADGGD